MNSTALAARNILPFSPDNIEIVHGMWTGGERSFPSLDPGLNFDDPFGLSPWAWIVRGTVWIARHGRAVGAAVGIGGRGISVAKEARRIPDSPQMNQLRDAAAKSQQLTVEIRGKTISFEPELPYEGMTNAGRGFHLGAKAFSSSAELTKTVLHELHRLNHSMSVGQGATAQAAAAETGSAADFATRAHALGQLLRWWP